MSLSDILTVGAAEEADEFVEATGRSPSALTSEVLVFGREAVAVLMYSVGHFPGIRRHGGFPQTPLGGPQCFSAPLGLELEEFPRSSDVAVCLWERSVPLRFSLGPSL